MKLPQEFVYLREINPRIVVDLQHYYPENFIGCRILGYHANEAICTRQTAEAVSKVQEKLENDGYTLVIYDAYRPLKAVHFIQEWSKDPNDDFQRNKYYPNMSKHNIFELGFFAEQTGHCRGSTVDVTFMKIGSRLKRNKWITRKLLNGEEILFHDDGTVDMGSSYDFFDHASYHNSNLVSKECIEKRNYLKSIMNLYGFQEYPKEWWHYTLVDEPFPNQYFDFDIEPFSNKK